MAWTEPAKFACVRTAVDLKIFESLTQAGEKGVSAAELAKPTGADVDLISRIMRNLVATWVIEETGPDRYCHTEASKHFVEAKYSDGIIVSADANWLPVVKLPAYLASTSWKDPQDPTNGPFQFAWDTKSIYWKWLAENPPNLAAFGNFMAGRRGDKKPWFATDFFPVQEKVIDESEGDVVLVDVAGGKGHDLAALVSAFPGLAGKVVLQDLPGVLAEIKPPLPSSIKTAAYDFFTPQPIQHARAYFLHGILHDWDDENCIKILKSLVPAMKPGYSKILINDLVVTDQGASAWATSLDIILCSLVSGKERTESNFKRIFEAAGLKIDKIWMYEPGTEAIIEASLPA